METRDIELKNNEEVHGDKERESPEKKEDKIPTRRTILGVLLLLVVYVGFNFLGAYIFIKIEHREEEGKLHGFNRIKEEFLANNSGCVSYEELQLFLQNVEKAVEDDAYPLVGNSTAYPHKWTIHNAFTLSFTIASTIGYGIVTPVTPGGQIFCIFFALFSIPFTGLLAAKMGSLMAYLIKKGTEKSFEKFIKAKVVSIAITFLLGLLLYVVMPTLVLLYVDNEEEQWSFVECLYCIFITLTTIGFGDYVPNPSSNAGGIYVSVIVLVYVVAGLAWLATIINLIAMAFKQQASTIKQKVVDNKINLRNISRKLSKKYKKQPSKPNKDTSERKETADTPPSRRDSWLGEEAPETYENTITGSLPGCNQRRDTGNEDDSNMLASSGLFSVLINNLDDYRESEDESQA